MTERGEWHAYFMANGTYHPEVIAKQNAKQAADLKKYGKHPFADPNRRGRDAPRRRGRHGRRRRGRTGSDKNRAPECMHWLREFEYAELHMPEPEPEPQSEKVITPPEPRWRRPPPTSFSKRIHNTTESIPELTYHGWF